MKRINKNNLLPWFTDDHRTLPASYLKSCEKFFKSLKQQASSNEELEGLKKYVREKKKPI